MYISDLTKNEQEFGKIIIDILECKANMPENKDVSVECLKLELHLFKDRYPDIQAMEPSNRAPKIVKKMLDSLCQKNELEKWIGGIYKLTNEGILLLHLKKRLSNRSE